ncbi:MAG: hypothetical protein KDB80_05130, partial [Planctomycetes bacterium]|nr:hypothetical protein [Planctomycetota bacterium]
MPVLLAVLSVIPALHAQPQDAPQDEVAKRIESLRRDLIQPGPESRQSRGVALDSLLLMTEPRAHRTVCDVYSLPPNEAPESIRLTILSKLASRWHLPTDPVFGEPNAKRVALHEIYANTLLDAFQGEDPVATEGELEQVQRGVWSCFRALAPIDRRNLFSTLVVTNDVERRRRVLWGIAGCRDLGLAPLIAGSLDTTGTLGAAARAALSMLTFVERPFRSRQEFDTWYASNTLLYVDLAERAARERTLAAASHVQLLEAELVGALASSENVDWQRIASLLDGAPSPEAMRLYLRRLDEVLAVRSQLGGTAESRLELVRLLQRGLDSGIDPVEYGLRLQVLARLAVDGESDSEAVIQRLVAATTHPDAGVRLAGIRGLALHFSPANRAVVVDAGRDARASGNAELLRAALECLAKRDWVAPVDENAKIQWLDLLRNVLVKDSLGVEFQTQAIEVLVQQTAEKARLEDAFRLLRDAAGPGLELQPIVRKQALARLRLFAESDRAGEYVEFVAGLLADSVAEVREAAARALRELPPGNRKQREAWTAIVVKEVGARLAVETQEAPLRAV